MIIYFWGGTMFHPCAHLTMRCFYLCEKLTHSCLLHWKIISCIKHLNSLASIEGHSENWTRDLSHPKRESFHYTKCPYNEAFWESKWYSYKGHFKNWTRDLCTRSEKHITRPNALSREHFFRIEGVLLQGAFQESTSRPLAPKESIIPLDQMPLDGTLSPLATTLRIIPLYQISLKGIPYFSSVY